MPGFQRQSWWEGRRDIRTLLIKFHKTFATYPQDRIFALLGIASDEGIIEPDYNLPIEKLSLKVLNFLLFGKLEEDAFLGSLNLHTSQKTKHKADPKKARKIFKWAVQNGLG